MASPSPNNALPLHLKADIRRTFKALTLPTAAVALVSGIPFLADLAHFRDNILHSSIAPIYLGITVLLLVLIFLFWKPGCLDVDERGIALRVGKRRYFYEWSDVQNAASVSNGVQLDVRGRSIARNKYNVIPNRFGMKPEALAGLIRVGIDRWGKAPSAAEGIALQRLGTVAPTPQTPRSAKRLAL